MRRVLLVLALTVCGIAQQVPTRYAFITQFGGSGRDRIMGLEQDRDGNLIVAGETTSTDLPATGLQPRFGGGSNDLFVAKFSSQGELLWATYFGGRSWEQLSRFRVDPASGSIVLLGATGSQGLIGPLVDRFVACIASDGQRLLWATPLGGLDGIALALDPGGDAWVAGRLSIGRFISQVYLRRINIQTGGIDWSSIYPDTVADLAFDVGGQIWIATGRGIMKGLPGSEQLITRVPAVGLATRAGRLCAFETTSTVACFTQDGQAIWRGLYPVMSSSLAPVFPRTSIALDEVGRVWIGGATDNRALPTKSVLQGPFNAYTGFLGTFDADAGNLVFSSYVGDRRSFGVVGIAVRDPRMVVFAGHTEVGPFSGPGDIFIAALQLDEPTKARIDEVHQVDGEEYRPLERGQRVVITGSGFGETAEIVIDDHPSFPPAEISDTRIIFVLTQPLPKASAVRVRLRTTTGLSNEVVLATQ